jgi:succinate dehydrogenase / fumarate reductase flavoprotein subunit
VHSIAAQGELMLQKIIKEMEIQLSACFDTVKGGDYRSREANVHRLAEVSVNHRPMRYARCAIGTEYGGLLDNRSLEGHW